METTIPVGMTSQVLSASPPPIGDETLLAIRGAIEKAREYAEFLDKQPGRDKVGAETMRRLANIAMCSLPVIETPDYASARLCDIHALRDAAIALAL